MAQKFRAHGLKDFFGYFMEPPGKSLDYTRLIVKPKKQLYFRLSLPQTGAAEEVRMLAS
jgi:hypothetical protein